MEERKLTEEEIIEIKKKLSCKWRRVTSWKIYKIKDKDGNIIPFIPNPSQLDYFKRKWYRNILPKARQIWFSTAIQIDFFDDALFNRNLNVWVQAQGKTAVQKIFRDKIKVARKHLPEFLKAYYVVDRNNANMFSFENTGSSIEVSATWFRSATLQRLHVSEHGKICAKHPEKAEELRTWTLPAVPKNGIVTIESTAEWQFWDFYDFVMDALDLQNSGAKLSRLEFKLFFYPWRKEEWYREPWEFPIPTKMLEYFVSLEKTYGILLDKEQRNRYYLQSKLLKDKMKQENPSVLKEAFEHPILWSYYGEAMIEVAEAKRICKVPYDPRLPVETSWDIWGAGGWDDMVVRFYQIFGLEVRVLEYWEWVGYSMIQVHTDILQKREYKNNYGTMILPHDANVHSQSTGKTRKETMIELWYDVYVVPIGSISDRIDEVKNTLPNCYFDRVKCDVGLKRLRNYRKKWDKSHAMYINTPAKDGNDHGADWFGAFAIRRTTDDIDSNPVDEPEYESAIDSMADGSTSPYKDPWLWENIIQGNPVDIEDYSDLL